MRPIPTRPPSLLSVTLLALIACGQSHDRPGDGGAVGPPETGADGGDHHDDATEPLRASRAELTQLEPLKLSAAEPQPGRTLVRGEHLLARQVTTSPPRLLVGRADEANQPASSVQLIDIDSGRSLAEVTSARPPCPEAGVVRVWHGPDRRAALLHLDDGAVIHPRPQLPDGTALPNPTIAASPESDQVLVFAQDPEGQTRFGLWSDLEQPEVTLDRRSPVQPRTFSYDRWAQAYVLRDGEGEPAREGFERGDCVRAHAPIHDEAHCLAWGTRQGARSAVGDQAWLAHGWVTDDGSGYLMALDLDGGRRQWLAPPNCRARLVAALERPPRVLSACQGEDTFSIWRPGASVLFDFEPGPDQAFHGHGTLRNPIVPSKLLDWGAGRSALWVDLIHGRLIETKPLTPLTAGSQPPVTFATRRGNGETTELIRLDFDRLEQRRVASFQDCPGELRLIDRAGDRLALACERLRPGTLTFELLWSEVLDLDLRRRWRTPAMAERLLDDGRLVASDQRTSGAEDHHAASRLFLLELPE